MAWSGSPTPSNSAAPSFPLGYRVGNFSREICPCAPPGERNCMTGLKRPLLPETIRATSTLTASTLEALAEVFAQNAPGEEHNSALRALNTDWRQFRSLIIPLFLNGSPRLA